VPLLAYDARVPLPYASQAARFLVALVTGLALAPACSSRAPAFVLAPIAETDAGERKAQLSAEGGAPSSAPPRMCQAMLHVGAVVATPASCWLDQKVAHKTAVLHYPCAGGPAEAAFGVPFQGIADESGAIDLSAKTTYKWSGDNCTWESTQRVRGVLAEGEVTYTYEEQPIAGDACSPAYCKATTPVTVQLK
jgi:hypothetical protein